MSTRMLLNQFPSQPSLVDFISAILRLGFPLVIGRPSVGLAVFSPSPSGCF